MTPIDDAVQSLLAQHVPDSISTRPVSEVLADLGLGPLPALPSEVVLPELPPLPALDLSLLVKPLTDLADAFGTGRLSADPGSDPAQVFSDISGTIQSVAQVGASALQVAMSLWQGMGADAASDTATQVQRDSAAVSLQSAQTSAHTVKAAGSVFTGAASMAAIIAKYLASVTAAAPFLATGGGQMFLLTMTAETLAEALVVVGKTRTELGIESAQLMQSGQKLPVSGAEGMDPVQILSQLAQLVPALSGMAVSAARAAGREPPGPESGSTQNDDLDGGVGRPSGAGGTGLPSTGIGSQPQYLAAWGPRSGFSAGGVPSSLPTAGSPGATPMTGSSPARGPGGMMPMGGLGAGLARPADESSAASARPAEVSESNGAEVVGEISGVTLPVVGAARHISEELQGGTPDKALTL